MILFCDDKIFLNSWHFGIIEFTFCFCQYLVWDSIVSNVGINFLSNYGQFAPNKWDTKAISLQNQWSYLFRHRFCISIIIDTEKEKIWKNEPIRGKSQIPLGENWEPSLENSGRKSLSLLFVSLTKSLKLVGSVRTIIYTFSDIAFSQCELLITIDN